MADRPRTRLTADQRRRARAHSILITTAFVLFWVPVIIFARLAGEVLEREPMPSDIAVMNAVHSVHSPLLDRFFLFLTAFGEPLFVGAVVLMLLALCLYKRWYRTIIVLIGGVGSSIVVDLILKAIFARTRPSVFYPLLHETTYSFPSGHSMVSSTFVFSVMLLVWHTRFRWPAVILGVAATFMIGLSRIYLGVHYPSDVLAGWSVGLIWAVLTGSLILDRPFALGRRLAPFLHR